MLLHRATIATPLGDMFALATESALCALEFRDAGRDDHLRAPLRRWLPGHAMGESYEEDVGGSRRR